MPAPGDRVRAGTQEGETPGPTGEVPALPAEERGRVSGQQAALALLPTACALSPLSGSAPRTAPAREDSGRPRPLAGRRVHYVIAGRPVFPPDGGGLDHCPAHRPSPPSGPLLL